MRRRLIARLLRPSLRRLRPSLRGLLRPRLRKVRRRVLPHAVSRRRRRLAGLLRPRLRRVRRLRLGRRDRGRGGMGPPPPRPPVGIRRSGPQRAHPSPQSPLLQSAIVGHSSVAGGMVQRLCFPVSGCVFVLVCISIAGRPFSRDRRQFTKAEPPASLLKTCFLTVVVGCRGGSLRGRRVRSANTWWASCRTGDAEAKRHEKKRDRAAAHDAEVQGGGWLPGPGLQALDQVSETAEIRFRAGSLQRLG